jgi:DNA-binding NtrC family response regulator
MPGDDGLVLLDKLKAALPQLPVVVMSAYTDVASTAGAFRGGAHEFLSKPFDLDDAVALAQRVLPAVAPALARPHLRPKRSDQPPQLVGDTPPMRALFRAIGRLAQAPLAVLITGETGTGKELVANALHRESPRAQGPFVALNTAAIPPNCWKASCSATKPAPSPARSAAISAASSRPTAARCSWMRSATCRCRCRPACCACWRRASSSASVAAS